MLSRYETGVDPSPIDIVTTICCTVLHIHQDERFSSSSHSGLEQLPPLVLLEFRDTVRTRIMRPCIRTLEFLLLVGFGVLFFFICLGKVAFRTTVPGT